LITIRVNKFLCLTIFLLITFGASAQKLDSTQFSKKAAQDGILPKSGKMDSLSVNAKRKSDSINGQLKKLQSFQLKVPKNHRTDSIQNVLNKDLSKPAAITSKINQRASNLSPQKQAALYNKRVRKLQKRLKHRIDSIVKLKVKDPGVAKSQAALKHNLDSIKNAGPIKDVKEAEQKLTKLESGMNSKVKGLEGKVNQELGGLKTVGVSTPNLNEPNTNIPNVSVPGLNTNLPNKNINTGLSANLPGVSSSSLGNSMLPSSGVSIPGTTTPGLNTNTSGLTNNLIPSGELQNLEKDASQLTKSTSELSQAEKGIQNVNPQTLEKDAENIGEVKQLNTEASQVEQYQKMVAKWQSDPDYRKELMVTQAKEQTINHFAGQEKQLMSGIQQLANVKKKYKGYEGALDMFKKPGNPMKGKPFVERLRPGLTMQVQVKHESLIDFNPQIGYRISGRLTIGLGWVERLGYDFSKLSYHPQDRIFGPRAYGQIKIKESIYVMLAPEMVNSFVPPSYSSPDIGTRKWVWSWMGGMKKEFRYSKKILGNLQILYNPLDAHNQSPYISKLNVRMGLEIPLKKKNK
jgi:hypothetical protein